MPSDYSGAGEPVAIPPGRATMPLPQSGSPGRMAQDQPEEKQKDDSEKQSKRAAVKRWFQRYNKAKAKWEADFTRMKENMDFVFGLQHEGQTALDDSEDRYQSNFTLHLIENYVAQLYAKNPTVEAIRRPRLDFAIWDGSVEMMQQSMMSMMQGNPMGALVMQDIMEGKQEQQLIERVARTLEKVDQIEIDTCKPEFKEQMKQLVRRVATCGVGFVRLSFVREGIDQVSSSEVRHSVVDRMKLLRTYIEKVQDDKIDEFSPEMDTIRSLVASIQLSAKKQDDYAITERIEHDFLPATSVIPDEQCRNLKEFIGARWVFIEYHMPLEDINSMFMLEGDKAIKTGDNLITDYEDKGFKQLSTEADEASDSQKASRSTLLEVIDYTTKTHAYIVKGHKDYVEEPTPFEFCVGGFWPLLALTFNSTEVTHDIRASIYPPSIIDLVKHAQKEWNRTREALRNQRNANAPTYLTRKNDLSFNDKTALRERQPNEVIELENVHGDQKLTDVVAVLQVAAIDPAVYDTRPLEQDVLLASGMQQANIGPAQPEVTATVGTIAEQSRMTATSSHADDLDDFLSRMARMRGEIRLQAMSQPVVTQVAGRGAVWPQLGRERFLNQIELRIKAASSGKPNKVLEIQNIERLGPLLVQAGANPIAVIEEYVKRLGDDQLDVAKFYPVPGLQPPLAGGVPGQPNQAGGPPGATPSPRAGRGAPGSPPPSPQMYQGSETGPMSQPQMVGAGPM